MRGSGRAPRARRPARALPPRASLRGRLRPLTDAAAAAQVAPWKEPPPEPAGETANAAHGAASGSGADAALSSAASSAGPSRRTTRPTKAKVEVQLVSEVQGITLHLDPRRTAAGYTGTGYKGVFDDYWPTGFKRDRPYTVTHEGRYQVGFERMPPAPTRARMPGRLLRLVTIDQC